MTTAKNTWAASELGAETFTSTDGHTAAELSIGGLSARLSGVPVLRGVDLRVDAGEVLGVVGPNGAGKSTLLRCLYRALAPDSGTVLVDGADLLAMDAARSARYTAALPQESEPVSGLRVRRVVLLGRTAYLRAWENPTARDHWIAEEALRRVGAYELADRDLGTLSGGERQRVLLARALTQEPRVLVLDEPLNHLDIRHQLEALRTVRDLGVTTVLAIHDLDLALRYCDRVCVLADGAVVAAGPPQEVLRPALMAEVFGVRSRQVEVEPGRFALWCEPLDTNEPAEPAHSFAPSSPVPSESSQSSEEEPAC
ncbi:ABC transporter ATP-binding protein [Streptomyces sp. ATCC 21386]|uniref:ABC transporter ATP-binding protein n=1 Tax=Streptomyces sp. ATCC 21386 TaxID=2699428 RepID=UPI0027E4B563|nr:ABC transporter ATP-binding protein [Streptomyces sp. ATCC 21386]